MALAPHQLFRPVVRHDQPFFELVPKSCIPTDEDKDFEHIAAAFTRPITDELTTGFDLVLLQFTLQDPEALYMMFCYLQHFIGTEFAYAHPPPILVTANDQKGHETSDNVVGGWQHSIQGFQLWCSHFCVL